jgi:hypothetical protein
MVQENLDEIKKIVSILKSENNGIVFGKGKKKSKNSKCMEKIASEQYSCKTWKQSADVNRLYPRFKHYNYSFSKKKNEAVIIESEIKKDWINKITKDTSL